ncbi:hypothetical protein BVRB_8g181510 isoform C [Beta vulgaris subsp. vulgaris]|nr:hypothetical protein BVRB_8g181510 isoform C [Beta vulgaris subsp. vulgaris]
MAQAIASKQVIEKYGPYGSQLPENYRVQLADGERFTKVTVEHGYIVDALKFEIAKPDGTTRTEWVGKGSPQTDKHHISQIVLQDGEYLTKLSGKLGIDIIWKQFGIATLKIHTNFNRAGYGPYGLGGCGMDNLTDFSSPDITNGPVFGVFGRHHNTLNSVGLFVRKNVIQQYGPYGSQLPENYRVQHADGERFTKIIVEHGYGPYGLGGWGMDNLTDFSSPDITNGLVVGVFGRHHNALNSVGLFVKKNGIEQYKPYGSQLPENYRVQLADGERFTKIILEHGYVVDAFKFEIAKPNGTTRTEWVGKGYGPYGLGGWGKDNLTDFSSPDITNGPVVGVFGRHHNALNSVGLFVKKD